MTSLIQQYGLVLLFVLVAAESSGLPVPGETALIAAALLANRGHHSIVTVIAVAAVAAIIGDNIGYWLGRTLGRGFLQRYGATRRFSERFLPPAERFFKAHGGKSVFLARWFSGVRVAGAWIAGFAHMHWWKFFFWNATGGIAWAVAVGVIAYYGGQAAADAFAHYGLIGGLVLVGILVALGIGVHLWRRRMMEQT